MFHYVLQKVMTSPICGVFSKNRMKRKGVIEFLGFLHSQKKYNHDIELTAFQCDENSHIGTHYFG